MTPTLAFVDCGERHLPALRAFLVRAYHPRYVLATDAALLRWQFKDTPASQGPPGDTGGFHFKLAMDHDDVAACLGYIPVQVTVGRYAVYGAWTANWMVAPEFRGLGLGPVLMRALTQQFPITLDAGISSEAASILPRMGWTDLGRLPRFVRILDAEGAAALTERGTLDYGTGRPPRSASRSVPPRITERSAVDDEATRLWDRLCERTDIGSRRTADFLNWRYTSHPTFRYRVFEARSERRLTGLAVYRVEPVRDLPIVVGRLLELIAEPSAAGALLEAVADDAAARHVVALDFFCSLARLVPALRRHGFEPESPSSTSRLPILFQPIDHRRQGIAVMASVRDLTLPARAAWYVTKGDGDQDRPN